MLWCVDVGVIRSYLNAHPESEFNVGSKLLPNGEEAFGVNISGVPFGDDKYVQSVMGDKVESVVSQI